MINFGFGVCLGSLDRCHKEQIRAWRNDRRIWRWCRQNDLITDVAQERWFERQGNDSSIRMYSIYAPEKNLKCDFFVGVCGLTSIDMTNRRAEFSLYIAPDQHGSGFGRAALKTLFTHGFNNLGLNSIWGETFDGNKAATLFEQLGMKKEGSRRDHYFRDGKFIDAHLYSILRSEWQLALPSAS